MNFFVILPFMLIVYAVVHSVTVNETYDNETVIVFAEPMVDFAFEPPPAACPSDATIFLVNGQPKECQPGVVTTCPPESLCYRDSTRNQYVCCIKLQGYCKVGQPYIDSSTSKPKSCRSDRLGDCLPPYTCQSLDNKSGPTEAYCCPDSLSVEPPPEGCPFGSRRMKDKNGAELPQCLPGVPNACPGSSICYTDTASGENRCCGVDPGEGCPSGMKALKNNGAPTPCLPGQASQACPGISVCQWNYLIDRYQCCLSDNGCPADGTVPFVDSSGKIQTCQQNPNSCQPNFSCEFNFWISDYQCCGKSLGSCPATQAASLDSSGLTQPCYNYSSASCATGYACVISTTNQPICCSANPGQPAAGYKFSTDRDGRYKSCLPTVANSCVAPSVCVASVGGPPGLSMCSERIARCPNGKAAYPTEADPAVCLFASNCPAGYTCDASQSDATVTLCCGLPGQATTSPATPTPTIRCPDNYTPQSGVYVPCTASWSNSCLKDASCQQSPNVPGIFLCCMPSVSPLGSRQCTQGGLYYGVTTRNPQVCNPNYIFTGCPNTHSLCLNFAPLNGFYCCKADVCSNGGEPCWLLGTTIPQYCGSNLGPCPGGFACLFSNFFGNNICCKQTMTTPYLQMNDAGVGAADVNLHKAANDAVPDVKKELDRMSALLRQSSIYFTVDEPKHHKG